ncbi:uncharacterized protein [Clinocottus analis]|uniref:uncharacterized protein n=1 Tax=Clinocottus analis TaxID=304258 RepID=UPI0035BF9DF3
MTSQARSPSALDLTNWCRGEGVDVEHALLMYGVPENITVDEIEETAETIKALGKVRVRGKMFHSQHQSLMVLCECREVIDPTKIPPEVMPIIGGNVWNTVHAVADQDAGSTKDFTEKLLTLLQQEGKTMDDIQRVCSPNIPGNSSPESIIRAVGDVWCRTNRAPDSTSYRRLRTYSGVTPTPTGEECLDSWLEQAKFIVDESECSVKEKRRRILESLKGPALEIIQAVRMTEPDASPMEYIHAIESIFGRSESGEDLYFSFRSLRQQPGERLSEFLQRLERSLIKVVQGGGLQVSAANKARIEQLIRGSTSDLMLLQLKVRERKDNPPTFLNLLQEIREEEGHQFARQSLGAPLRRQNVRAVQAEKGFEPELAYQSEFRAQMEEMKAKMGERTRTQHQLPSDCPISGPKEMKKPTESHNELQSLKKQVKALEDKMSVMAVKSTVDSSRETMSQFNRYRAASSHKPVPFKVQSPKESDEYFCYRCGENGHIAPRCTEPENPQKVIKRLIRVVRGAQDGTKENPKNTSEDQRVGRVHKVEVPDKDPRLPEGLVGPSMTHPIKVNELSCQALMDSGSNVTIIFESWYNEHLLDVPIQPVSGLGLWGLSDTDYPYKGYVVVEMEFPEKMTGVKGPIAVLALICPEPKNYNQTPVIVGTNASLFHRLWELMKESGNENIVHSMRIQPFYAPVQTQLCKSVAIDDVVGQVKWQGPGPLSISPGEKCYAICKVDRPTPVSKDIVLIDAPTSQSLPAGVLVQPGVLPNADLDTNCFTVLVHNESQKKTSIPIGTVIAEMYAVDTITPVQPSNLPADAIDPGLFDFGDSPIPEKWKNRIRQKLAEKQHVFSLQEWDVGLAKGVEHPIRLHDPRPFRERSRRLAPADIDDVRRHIQQLLAAGIIKESRSPYASPIVVVRKKNGNIRICIDYRTLNRRTIPDQYTMPRIDDALDCLSGSKWFSVLDLRSGYYQIAMKEEDKEKTAFICPLGFYQFERMPQGITGAPATFQRLMEKAVE